MKVLRLAFLLTALAASAAAKRPPNVVILFIDDMGYADIGPFGARSYSTPHLDRMAREGRQFTDFYVTQAVCSASRAGLMTGSYNVRVSILGALGPTATHGIHEDEVTLAEICKQRGYATACYGKWHLGHHEKFLPPRHGFDDYFGLPYSNDMWPYHPEKPGGFPPLPLIDGIRAVNANVTARDQEQLTTQYTERAVAFIERHRNQPFLLYVPHSMVHVPLFVSDKFRGKSKRGLFGDVVMEVDWSAGRILDTIRNNGLEKDTLVIFTADNGPWLSYGDHAGSAGPLREGKGTMFEGGCREPTLMWWPGTIPAGTRCTEPAMTIDILPTVARLIGAKLPEHKIDGRDIGPLMRGEAGAQSPQEAYYFYYGTQLQAVRKGRWKLHFPHSFQSLSGRRGGQGGVPVKYDKKEIGLALFDLEKDPGETTDVKEQHPGVVREIEALADRMREDLGDSARGLKGKGVRPAGQL